MRIEGNKMQQGVVENNRENNFNIIRLLAAFMVISGHMGHIMGTGRPVLMGQEVHTLGVKIFFLIGGYLITKSYESDHSIVKYAIKRFFRIWPPLVVSVLITALFIAPFFSTYSISDYYKDPLLVYHCVRNIMLYPIFALPGVYTNNPLPNTVNGSLWSLPVEVMMYVWVPIIVLIVFGKKEKINFILMLFITAISCVMQIMHVLYFQNVHLIIYGSDLAQAMDLIPFYLIGMLFTFKYLKKYLNIQVAVLLLIICSSITVPFEYGYLLTYTVFPYIVFSIAFAKNPFFGSKIPTRKWEISYGLFLFGFPIQQSVESLVIENNIQLDFIVELLISLSLTVVLAFLLHNFIEENVVRLSKVLINKIKVEKVN